MQSGGYLYAEIHYLALLSGQAHLEGSLSARQASCTATVYRPEQLHAPSLCIILISNMRLHSSWSHATSYSSESSYIKGQQVQKSPFCWLCHIGAVVGLVSWFL